LKKNSCGTSIARASLGPRRGRRRARLIGERRRPTPTTTTTTTTPSTAAATGHRTTRRPPPTKVGTALALVVHRAQSPGGCPRPVDTRTPAVGGGDGGGLRAHTPTPAHRRAVTVRRVYMQSTGGSSTSRRCSLCCSVWWWWCFVFGSRAPTDDTSPRPTDSDGRGPSRREMGRVLL